MVADNWLKHRSIPIKRSYTQIEYKVDDAHVIEPIVKKPRVRPPISNRSCSPQQQQQQNDKNNVSEAKKIITKELRVVLKRLDVATLRKNGVTCKNRGNKQAQRKNRKQPCRCNVCRCV